MENAAILQWMKNPPVADASPDRPYAAFGSLLRTLRTDRQWSQYHAEPAIHRNTLAAWERGTRRPNDAGIRALAGLYQVPEGLLRALSQHGTIPRDWSSPTNFAHHSATWATIRAIESVGMSGNRDAYIQWLDQRWFSESADEWVSFGAQALAESTATDLALLIAERCYQAQVWSESYRWYLAAAHKCAPDSDSYGGICLRLATLAWWRATDPQRAMVHWYRETAQWAEHCGDRWLQAWVLGEAARHACWGPQTLNAQAVSGLVRAFDEAASTWPGDPWFAQVGQLLVAHEKKQFGWSDFARIADPDAQLQYVTAWWESCTPASAVWEILGMIWRNRWMDPKVSASSRTCAFWHYARYIASHAKDVALTPDQVHHIHRSWERLRIHHRWSVRWRVNDRHADFLSNRLNGSQFSTEQFFDYGIDRCNETIGSSYDVWPSRVCLYGNPSNTQNHSAS